MKRIFLILLLSGNAAFASWSSAVMNYNFTIVNNGSSAWGSGSCKLTWSSNWTPYSGQYYTPAVAAHSSVTISGTTTMAGNATGGASDAVIVTFNDGETFNSGTYNVPGTTFNFSCTKTFVVSGDGCSLLSTNPPCHKDASVSYQNNDAVAHGVNFVFASGLVEGPYIAQPGETLNAHFTIDCSDSYVGASIVPALGVSIDTGAHTNQYSDSGSLTNGYAFTNTVTGTIANPPILTGTNPATSGSTYNVTNSPSQIVWTAAAATNTSVSVQQGSSAIYDAVTRGFSVAHQDSSVIHSDLTGIASTLNSINAKTGTNGSDGGQIVTNYSTETTLESLTNYFGNALTNQFATNPASVYAAGSGLASGSNSFAGLTTGISANPLTTTERYGDSGAVVWTVAVPYLDVGSIDLNPMNNTDIAAIANFMRFAIKWVCLVSLVGANFSALMSALNALGSTRQASASGQAILGVNANLVTALAMATLITAVMLAVPAFALSQFTEYASTLAANPFNGVTGIMAASVWLADQFFPLAVIVACPIAFYAFRASLAAIVWGVQTATRFLVG